jgi:hypothetical protein
MTHIPEKRSENNGFGTKKVLLHLFSTKRAFLVQLGIMRHRLIKSRAADLVS